MYRFAELEISWDGPPGTSFMDDVVAPATPSAGLQAYLVVTGKTMTLTDQITVSGAAASLLATIEQQPLLTGVIAVILLSAVSPASLDIVSNDEGRFLNLIQEHRTGYYVDEGGVRALLADDLLADRLIESLCDKGLLRRNNNDRLVVLRKVLANVRIGPRD